MNRRNKENFLKENNQIELENTNSIENFPFEKEREKRKEKEKESLLSSLSPPKIKGEISFIQHNVGKRQETHQTILEISFLRKIDIILLQEPAVWKNTLENRFFSISHPAFDLILPEKEKIRPRVLIYIRKNVVFQYKKDYSFPQDNDFLSLEISGTLEKFLIFNIYNEKELDSESNSQKKGENTIKRILLPIEEIRSPFLIAGDFNAHHYWWNSTISEKQSKSSQDLVDWLVTFNCELLNLEEEKETFFRSNLKGKSIIDLAFTSNFQENTWEKWNIIEETGSDHIAISFSTFTRQTERVINPLIDLPYNLKKARWEELEENLLEAQKRENFLFQFQELENSLKRKISLENFSLDKRKNSLEWKEILSSIDLLIERFTTFLQTIIDKYIPRAKISEFSKPWWNEHLSKLRKRLAIQKRLFKKNRENQFLLEKYKEARNKYFQAIRKEKSSCWNNFLEKAKGKEIFKALKYTKAQATTIRKIPPIVFKRENQEEVEANTFLLKSEAFLTTLFPKPPITKEIKWEYKEKNWEWPELQEIEIENSIFSSSPKKAPGPDKISFAILQKIYPSIRKELYYLYSILFSIGYHPKKWKESIGVILPKPNKENYSIPKAYRIISLLNCFGKVLEKIFAIRLGYLANTSQLLEENQLGGRQQRSSIDTVLLLLNYIQKERIKKKNQALISSTLFLDIKGAFNHVSKN